MATVEEVEREGGEGISAEQKHETKIECRSTAAWQVKGTGWTLVGLLPESRGAICGLRRDGKSGLKPENPPLPVL